MNNEKIDYIVTTHLKDEPTRATSAKRALSNVRFRYFGTQYHIAARYCPNWKVRKAVA